MIHFSLEPILRNLFRRYGRFVHSFRWPLLLTPPLISLCLSIGFLWFGELEVDDPAYVFTPRDARWKRELGTFSKLWPLEENKFIPGKSFETKRFVHVLCKAKDGGNVLRPDILDEISLLNKFIAENVSIPTADRQFNLSYQDLCLSYDWVCGSNEHIEMFRRMAQVGRVIDLRYPKGGNKDTPAYLGTAIGDIKLNETDGTVLEAKITQLFYFLKQSPPIVQQYSTDFEYAVERFLLHGFESSLISISFAHYQSLQDGLDENARRFVPNFVISIVLLTVFCICCSFTFLPDTAPLPRPAFPIDWIRSKPYVACAGLINTLLALISSFGFLLLLGIPYNVINTIIPFLIIAVGIDDMFVMNSCWDQSDSALAPEERMAEMMQNGGVAVSITNITDILAFLIGCITELPGIELFCLYAFAAILFCYVYQLTFFAAFMAIMGNVEQQGKHCLLLSRRVPRVSDSLASINASSAGGGESDASGGTPSYTECSAKNCQHPGAVVQHDHGGGGIVVSTNTSINRGTIMPAEQSDQMSQSDQTSSSAEADQCSSVDDCDQVGQPAATTTVCGTETTSHRRRNDHVQQARHTDPNGPPNIGHSRLRNTDVNRLRNIDQNGPPNTDHSRLRNNDQNGTTTNTDHSRMRDTDQEEPPNADHSRLRNTDHNGLPASNTNKVHARHTDQNRLRNTDQNVQPPPPCQRLSAVHPAAVVGTTTTISNHLHHHHQRRSVNISHRFFGHYFGPLLLHPITRALITIAYIGYLGLAIVGCLNFREGLEPSHLVTADHYIARYFEDMKTFWKLGPQLHIAVLNPPNLTDPSERQKLLKAVASFENTPYTMGREGTVFFFLEFLNYLDQLNAEPENTDRIWHKKLRSWLKNTGASNQWDSDIVYMETGAFRAFRFQVAMKDIVEPDQHKLAAKLLREIADRQPFHLEIYHEAFPFADQYLIILPSTYRNVLISLLCMTVIALLLIPSVLSAILIILSIVSISTGVFGYMTFWGVNLDAVSMISIIMSIGFAVDLSAHIVYAFVTAPGEQSPERVINALEHIGWPIFQGAASTIVGISVLYTVDAYIILTFFKTIWLTMVMGLVHGLVFIPVLLSFLPIKFFQIRPRHNQSFTKSTKR